MKVIIGATNVSTIVDLKIIDRDIEYYEHVLFRMSTTPYSNYFFLDLVNENKEEIEKIDLNQFHVLYYDSLYMDKGFYRGYLALNTKDVNIKHYAKLIGEDFLNYLYTQLNEKEILYLLEVIGYRRVHFTPISVIESLANDIRNMAQQK